MSTPAGPPTAPAQGTALLRGAGLRATAPRVAALAVLADQPHADADDVARGVRERIGSVSVQAVYDVLGALQRAGLVRRIEPAGSPARFELRVDDNHHHLVCRGCGEVRDVDCATGAAPCLEPARPRGAGTGGGAALDGFVVDEAEVIYWGTCSRCSAR
ncbi:Fur family transcriptional regulator [uncultured Pseudokineococcus sp.]|uniref:Fur family transcriptional regulator n=1 Tax=uncultured Pseudokineococcus sp. TaxID=1642928 RepID=UPI00261C10DE|nr:Fur family transcriptional regulator [uncultured Pseudokineococcus sp.]